MPLYGVTTSRRAGIRHGTRIDNYVLEQLMKTTPEQDPETYDLASPKRMRRRAADVLFTGTHDTLVWVEEARRFIAELSAVSAQPLVYAELAGAQHAFETVHSMRTSHYLNAAAWWLEGPMGTGAAPGLRIKQYRPSANPALPVLQPAQFPFAAPWVQDEDSGTPLWQPAPGRLGRGHLRPTSSATERGGRSGSAPGCRWCSTSLRSPDCRWPRSRAGWVPQPRAPQPDHFVRRR